MFKTTSKQVIVTLLICVQSCVGIFLPASTQAQMNYILPDPGTKVLVSRPYAPLIMKGMVIYPDNPLKFDFIVDAGDSRADLGSQSADIERLIKYFLTSLTIPDEQFWVNLSPYEEDRTIAAGLNKTVMGRDLLAQDYMLKQLTASLLAPDEEIGRQFWEAVNKNFQGQIDIEKASHNLLNKIWIVPEKAEIYVKDRKAFVVDAHLKVLLEEDYLAAKEWRQRKGALNRYQPTDSDTSDTTMDVTTALMKEFLLPAVEQEVNQGETFANLRQIYHAMILASWFKTHLRNNFLGHVYINQSKTKGVELKDPQAPHRIYDRYLEAFRVGVYDMIREDYDSSVQEVVPRRYFSGGIQADMLQDVARVHGDGDEGGGSDDAMITQIYEGITKPYLIAVGLKSSSGAIRFDQEFSLTPALDPVKQKQLSDALFEGDADLSENSLFRVLLSIPEEQRTVENILYRSAFLHLLHTIDQKNVVSEFLKKIEQQKRINYLAYVLNDILTSVFASGEWTTADGARFDFEQQLAASPVHMMQGMMAALSMQDAGAQLDTDGEIDYQNSFQKVRELIPLLARDGISTLYFYGGLYDIGSISKQLHQVSTAGAHYLKSDEGQALVKIEGYTTKRMYMPGAGKQNVLYDKFGNNFSIYGVGVFNPKLSSVPTQEDPEPQSAEKAEREFKELVAFAKSFGIDVVTDFMGWVAPDAINESNYHWTSYRRIAEEWSGEDWAKYRALDPQAKKAYFITLLDKNGLDFVYDSTEGPILIRHFNYGMNRDQVILNAFLPEVQDYYISSIKKMIDLGVTGMRVDLAHFLLKAHLKNIFPEDAANAKEPWLRIMSEVREYAQQKGADFTFIMETYDWDSKNMLTRLGQASKINVQVYHTPVEDAYINVVRNGHSAKELAEEINTAIFFAHTDKQRRSAPATFDDQSLKNNGGPTEGIMRLFLILAEFKVPVFFDLLREWILHHGHVISVVGGRSPDGVITHPFVNEEEFKRRIEEYGLRDRLEEMPWRNFVRIVQGLKEDSSQFIRQEHADYPWHMFDYTYREDRDRYITVGWRNGNNLVLYTLDMRPSEEGVVHLKIAAGQVEGLDRDREVSIYFRPGQESLLYTVKYDQEHDGFNISVAQQRLQNSPAVKKKNPGGIDLDPQQLDLSVQGKMIWFADPLGFIYQHDISIEGISPVIIHTAPIENMPSFLIGENTDLKRQTLQASQL